MAIKIGTSFAKCLTSWVILLTLANNNECKKVSDWKIIHVKRNTSDPFVVEIILPLSCHSLIVLLWPLMNGSYFHRFRQWVLLYRSCDYFISNSLFTRFEERLKTDKLAARLVFYPSPSFLPLRGSSLKLGIGIRFDEFRGKWKMG